MSKVCTCKEEEEGEKGGGGRDKDEAAYKRLQNFIQRVG